MILVTVSIGGLVEIVPLFTIETTIERVEGVRPYSPLELAGRNIYIREGCYNCHSQMIRPFRDEVERYGPYSLAAESMYDHPFQWGSKRTGPDLARVGGRYSNVWQTAHLINPRALVPESCHAGLPVPGRAEPVLQRRCRPSSDEPRGRCAVYGRDDRECQADLLAQASPEADYEDLLVRYPKAAVGDFDGNPRALTEMDALVAYLQILGRMVDFGEVTPDDLKQ